MNVKRVECYEKSTPLSEQLAAAPPRPPQTRSEGGDVTGSGECGECGDRDRGGEDDAGDEAGTNCC